MSARCFLAAVLIAAALPAEAQVWDSLVSSKLEVTIGHRPTLPLKISAVAFEHPEGRCAEPILGLIESDFVQSGIAVVDRARLEQVLREQKLQVSGLIDEKTAANVGKLLGAQALVFLKVLDCGTERRTESYADKEGNQRTKFVTLGSVHATMRTVDLTTGRVLASQSLNESSGWESPGGYPDDQETLGKVEGDVARAVHRTFLPWLEKRTVVFYSDKECNLKSAYDSLRVKDMEGALKSAEDGLASCRDNSRVKQKTLGRAYYNLGLVQFLMNSHDAAVANLSDAAKIQNGDIVAKLLAEARQARVAAAESGSGAPAVAPPRGPETSVSAAAGTGTRSVQARLEQLEALKAKGLITPAEYDRKRSEILDGL